MATVKDYKDLIVWNKACQFVKDIYTVTADFPKNEIYGLTSQMRRAAVSIPANIAEGSSRFSPKDYAHFLSIGLGSANELETFLILAHQLNFLAKNDMERLCQQLNEVIRMLRKMRDVMKDKAGK